MMGMLPSHQVNGSPTKGPSMHPKGTTNPRRTHPGRTTSHDRQGRHLARSCLVGAAVLALMGCGDTGTSSGAGDSPTETTTGPVETASPVELSVVQVVEDVRFYPACGNEVVEVDGVIWYPLLPEERDGLDRTHVPDASAAGLPAALADLLPAARPAAPAVVSTAVPAALLAIPAPGPGDDVGTLWIFSDGLAFWEADSGTLRAWLTQEERTYDWVC